MAIHQENNLPDRHFDIICLGRVAVDLYAEQVHSSLSDAQTFRKYVGGCAGNIAIGASRLGLRSVMLSKVGKDDMGDFIADTLEKEGVETAYLQRTPEHLTGLVLLGVNPPNHFPLMFYRDNCADMQLKPSDCNLPIWHQAKALLITGTGFSTKEMRQTSQHAVEQAKLHAVKVVLDLDYRPVLWGVTSKGDGESRFFQSLAVSEHYQKFLKNCDLIVGTEEEFFIATGKTNIEDALAFLKKICDALLVVKQGAKGCCIHFNKNDTINCPSDKIKVLNVLGAGDAFMSGFLRGWLKNKSLETCAQYANASGAIVVSRHGCAPAIPYWHELTYYLQQNNKQQSLQSKTLNDIHQSHQCFGRSKIC